MTIDLSPEEIEMLSLWYNSAAGESCGADTLEEFVLLEKLGIPANDMDLWEPDPESWTEAHRPVIIAQIAAIRAYKERHPNWEDEA